MSIKHKASKILSKPKMVIPIFAVIGIVALTFTYNIVGKAPSIELNSEIKDSNTVVESNNINLAFPKTGRLDEVNVKVGDKVVKGQVLAKLYAPDSEGTVSQAKGSLQLAEAQYELLNSQYATTKKQQDLIVKNAYSSLLSTGLEATPDDQTDDSIVITGTYTCGKEGQYIIKPYRSGDNDTGYSFAYSDLEEGIASVKYQNPVALGNCGLQVKWNTGIDEHLNSNIEWTINIPNTKSSSYLTYKNAYDLAVETCDKTLSDLEKNIGENTDENSVAKATVEAARGAYEAARGAYQNNLIVAPDNGIVNFVDDNLKVGQSVTLNKTVISITKE